MELSGREGWDYYDKAKGVRVRLVKRRWSDQSGGWQQFWHVRWQGINKMWSTTTVPEGLGAAARAALM